MVKLTELLETEITTVNNLENEAWETFQDENTIASNKQAAMVVIQWCIQRRSAAFQMLNGAVQIENMSPAQRRSILA